MLRRGPEPDLILADIRLSDGLVLDLFDQVLVRCPVIFTTAYDAYLMQAFERNAIDYVLKPVSPDRLGKAMKIRAAGGALQCPARGPSGDSQAPWRAVEPSADSRSGGGLVRRGVGRTNRLVHE